MTTLEAFGKLNENKALAEKIGTECKTPEQVFDVLKSIGLTDDFDTFKKAVDGISAAASEMNETDVEAIAGGIGGHTTITEPINTPIDPQASAAASASV